MDPHAETSEPGSQPMPRKRLSRRATLIGSLLALLLLAGTGWLAWHLTRPASEADGAGRPGGPNRRTATTVGVATAERAGIPIVLEALGTVTPQASVRVRPQVSGVMEKVLFKEGQMVRAGDLLATIDPRQFEMALMQASGQRQRDEAQLNSARVTLKRFQTLLQQDSIARQEVDTQAALVKQLEGTVVIDKAAEGTARLNLSYTRVVAPISGRVGLRSVDVGNVVSNSDVLGIALITQVSPIDVVFAVPQDQAAELQQAANSGSAAMKVSALDRNRSSTLDTGVFASLDNQVDIQTGTVKAKARFANSTQALFPSQFVNVKLLVRTIENAVVVPVTALRHGSTGDYVYVLNSAERTVTLRPVKPGQATVDKIVIASGLQAGERVITEGADRLKDGASVVLPGDAPNDARGGGKGGAKGDKSGKRTGQREGPPDGVASPSAPAASAASAPAAEAPASGTAPQRRRRASQAEGS
jgi:membrane fusion protein, multidrug efflux system